jgi:hypothetical protein
MLPSIVTSGDVIVIDVVALTVTVGEFIVIDVVALTVTVGEFIVTALGDVMVIPEL